MKKLIYTLGLPGSGKSTRATEYILARPAGQVARVNRDTLREMINANRWKGNKTESPVVAARDALIDLFLGQDREVIVDDTNLDPKVQARLMQLAIAHEAPVEVWDLTDVPISVCIERDLKRERSVGEKVIKQMYTKYLEPPTEQYIEDDTLPWAIVCDIDGTLAHMNGRSPYEFDKVSTDEVDVVVKDLVIDAFNRGDRIIVMSGRDDICQTISEVWLTAKGIPWHETHFRVTGDKRKDSIVKRELFDASVRGQYRVRFVLDDRDQVVEGWRAMGLKCLQVAAGSF